MWDSIKRWVFVPIALLIGLFGWIAYLLASKRTLEDQLQASERSKKLQEITNGLDKAHEETETKLETYRRLRDGYLNDDSDPDGGPGGHA